VHIFLAISLYIFLGILKPADIPTSWKDMVDLCIKAMESQVKTEMEAAMKYLAMVYRS